MRYVLPTWNQCCGSGSAFIFAPTVDLDPGGTAIWPKRVGWPLRATPVPLHRLKRTAIPLRLEVKPNLSENMIKLDSELARASSSGQGSEPCPQGQEEADHREAQ